MRDRSNDDIVLNTLLSELDRISAGFAGLPDPPYFIGYRVTETRTIDVAARHGCLDESQRHAQRILDVTARVGDRFVDSTHPLREDWFDDRLRGRPIPVEDDPLALRLGIWRHTEEAIRLAQERILRVRANRRVKVDESDPSPDMSAETPIVALDPPAALDFDPVPWEQQLVRLSAVLDGDPHVQRAEASLEAVVQTTWIVTSEGTRIRRPRVSVRVSLAAATTAPDGMELSLHRWKDVRDPSRLPAAPELEAWAAELLRDLVALRCAPLGEPYSGPVLLRGAAAGVWVHEVLGHRVEGHRQKDEDEGQTFRELVGQRILPPAIQVWDDPTVATYAGEDLNGHYLYDDEGQPARRAEIVRDGVFQGFLMSRSPIRGFEHSNGHGRAQPGQRPVSRMANTVLETKEPVPYEALRERLIAIARERGRPYGLLVCDLAGGFTLTGRILPNAFNVRAETVWRVWTDGRPDELVRGLDIVGTPLVALSHLVAAGDDPGVFNGHCGAESGSVPNSAVSPTLLLEQAEFQRKEKGQDRPPLLPKPPPSSSLVDGLVAELGRASELKVPDALPPYFVGYDVVDASTISVRAVLGAIVRDDRERDRRLGVGVRVGSPALDNGNFEEAWLGGFDDAPMVLEDPGSARDAWLATDVCYKAALQNLARKEAARRGRAAVNRPPDFAPGRAHVAEAPPAPPHDADALVAVARELSARFRPYPALERSKILLDAWSGWRVALDTVGTRVARPVEQVLLRAVGTARAADGHEITAHGAWVTRREPPPDVAVEIDAFGRRLQAWSEAPLATEEYVGPVIFEGEAAIALFRHMLVPGLSATPPVEREDDEAEPEGPSPFALKRRILPQGWRVEDDPRRDPELPSSYTHDDEGVPAERVLLVDDGIVRGLVASRIPGRGVPASNGHGRGIPGEPARGVPSNVFVRPAAIDTAEQLRARGVAMAEAYDLDHVLVVRALAMDKPGLSLPLELVRVYADGREQLLRGLEFAETDRRLLRDIVAAGPALSRTYALRVAESGYDAFTSAAGAIAVTLTAPSVLVSEMELDLEVRSAKRPPVVPSPLRS